MHNYEVQKLKWLTYSGIEILSHNCTFIYSKIKEGIQEGSLHRAPDEGSPPR